MNENSSMKIHKLNDEELAVWLSFARTLGSTKFFSVLRACGSLNKASEYLNKLINN